MALTYHVDLLELGLFLDEVGKGDRNIQEKEANETHLLMFPNVLKIDKVS